MDDRNEEIQQFSVAVQLVVISHEVSEFRREYYVLDITNLAYFVLDISGGSHRTHVINGGFVELIDFVIFTRIIWNIQGVLIKVPEDCSMILTSICLSFVAYFGR